MSCGLADPIRMMIFGCMNTEKAKNSLRVDQRERALVAGLQMKNAASGVLDLAHGKTGVVADGLNTISGTIKTARTSSKIFDKLCKGVNVLSKMVNPILCVASAVRAYKAEDKKSAAIKEGCAMGTMFGAEWAYKQLFGLGGATAKYQNFKPISTLINAGKKFCASNKFLKFLPQGQLGSLIKALGFIAASCGAFELGSKVGKSIADKTTAKTFAQKKAALEVQNATQNETNKINDNKNSETTKNFIA